ncbi:MAG: CcmD family protein [Dethiobacter sp.]|jgi:CcmD family protein|nr:CcmD family protein [Dethiobacter sp.]
MYYFFAAYLTIWIILFGYSLLQGHRQKKLAAEVEMLSEALQKKNAV